MDNSNRGGIYYKVTFCLRAVSTSSIKFCITLLVSVGLKVSNIAVICSHDGSHDLSLIQMQTYPLLVLVEQPHLAIELQVPHLHKEVG